MTTYRDTVIKRIPDNLVLHLLPSLQRLINQHLAGVRKRRRSQGDELFLVVGKPRAETTEGVSGTNQDWIADVCCRFHCLLSNMWEKMVGLT